MPRKRYCTEQIVTKLRQAEVELGRGLRTLGAGHFLTADSTNRKESTSRERVSEIAFSWQVGWQWKWKSNLLLDLGAGLHLDAAVLLDRHLQHHRPTADLTVLDVVLASDGGVGEDLKRFPAGGTLDRVGAHEWLGVGRHADLQLLEPASASSHPHIQGCLHTLIHPYRTWSGSMFSAM